MFPPEPIEKPEDWLNNLFASLQRAGGHFSGEARLLQTTTGVEGVLYLSSTPPRSGLTAMKSYIRKYSRECGWNVTTIEVTQRYVVVRASRAESKAARNP